MDNTGTLVEVTEDFAVPAQVPDLLELLRRAVCRNNCTNITISSDGFVRISAYVAEQGQRIDVGADPIDLRQLLSEVDMEEVTGNFSGGTALVAAAKCATKHSLYVIGILASSEKDLKPYFDTDWEVQLRPLVTGTVYEFLGLQVGFVPDVLDCYTLLFMCGKTRSASLAEATLAVKIVL